MLEKGGYDTWQSRMLLYVEGKEHGEMLLDSIFHCPFQYKVTRKEYDIKAANFILYGLPNDIYTLLNHKTIAYEIRYMVKELKEGTELTKQEKESKLADEFDRFTSEKGVKIESYYMRSFKLINDINIIGLEMKPLQVNTKFVNHLQLEWSRFVTGVKQANNLYQVSFNQLYAYLKQNEPDANEYNPQLLVAAQQPYISQPSYEPPVVYQQPYIVYQQPLVVYQQPPDRHTLPDSGFVVPTFLPMDDPIASLNKAMMFLTTAISSRYPPTNNQLGTSSNPITQANIQDEREKMFLTQQQEAGIDISDEQQDLLDDELEEKVDAYDSEVDGAPTASAIFMAMLSPAGYNSGDEAGPSYDSNILSEVPNYETYCNIREFSEF
ncbi:hypothetical protein Tco_0511977 [Tanacetum coccineum]